MLIMSWYNFLGHEHSVFNVITRHSIALKTLKTHKLLTGICTFKDITFSC